MTGSHVVSIVGLIQMLLPLRIGITINLMILQDKVVVLK